MTLITRSACLLLLCLSLGVCADTPWTQSPTVLVGLGDSVTAGFGASPGHDYWSLLKTALSAHLPNLTVVQRAVSGTTSDFHLRSIDQLLSYPPESHGIVVMTTGGNDVIHNYGRTSPREFAMYGASRQQADPWIQSFDTRLETMYRKLSQKFPGGLELFVSNLYDPTDGQGDIEHAGLPAWPDGLAVLSAYNQVLAAFCRRHGNTHLVDLHALFMGHGIHGTVLLIPLRPSDPNYWYYGNLEDPNDRGYEAAYHAFLAPITRYRLP